MKIGSHTVGRGINYSEINEFVFTRASTTDPPEFQRYSFSKDGSEYVFYYEKREGRHLPLTEKDITESKSVKLSKEEWEEYLSYIDGGTVRKRSKSTETGDSGPFMYLYWKGDKGKYQEFKFSKYEKQYEFEEFCKSLMK